MIKVRLPAYLEKSGPRHHKFYAVAVLEETVHLRWGRIGKAGRTHQVLCDTRVDAQRVARDKVRQKLRRGYVVTRRPTQPRAVPPTRCNRTLEMFSNT